LVTPNLDYEEQMMLTMSPGEKRAVSDLTASRQLDVTARHAPDDIDIVAFGLNAKRTIADDRYTILFSNARSPDGAITYRRASGATVISIALDRLPASLDRISLVASHDTMLSGTRVNSAPTSPGSLLFSHCPISATKGGDPARPVSSQRGMAPRRRRAGLFRWPRQPRAPPWRRGGRSPGSTSRSTFLATGLPEQGRLAQTEGRGLAQSSGSTRRRPKSSS
jgi:hypothetical protein